VTSVIAHSFLSLLTLLLSIRRGGLAEILCKPKILPLKSAVLEQLQKIEQAADIAAEENQ